MLVLSRPEVSRYRRIAGGSRCPVVVVEGDSPPRLYGEPGYTEFYHGGGRMGSPGAAIKAGYRARYVRSTLRVEVGTQWVWLDRLRRRVGLTEDAPEYAILDRARQEGWITDQF